jgi:ADP-ribose pyrophosphatase
MEHWKTISRRTILTHSKFLTVEEHTVQLPNGRIIEDWPWVVTPDFVNVVAVTEDGRFLLFRQTKYSIPGDTLAPVGGYLEPGEDPLAAGQRELREETGYAAPDWQFIGQFPVDGNRGAGTAYFYIARRARPVTAIDADDLEEQELLLLTRAEVEAALDAGEIKLLPWTAVVALALRQI